MDTSSSKKDTVMSKTFYLKKQVYYTFDSLILVAEKEGQEGNRA